MIFLREATPMSAWTEDDKRIAARALKTLEQASVASRGVAIYYLEPVRREMGIKRPNDIPERSDAWLAVCSLCEALAKPDSEEQVSKWRDAINKTPSYERSRSRSFSTTASLCASSCAENTSVIRPRRASVRSRSNSSG
jgi:hypothetical protein